MHAEQDRGREACTTSAVDLFGFEVQVRFRVHNARLLAYGWHWDGVRAEHHLDAIVQYHHLPGETLESGEFETWLLQELEAVVRGGATFEPPRYAYRELSVWQALIAIPRGNTSTYVDLAKAAGTPYPKLLAILLKNPFQVLLPCHRLVTKKGTLMGFHPLGVAVKRRLLELEGVQMGE